MKKVMVFGAFDGFHPGHLDFFRQARKHGDFLVVSVARDVNIPTFKGSPSMFDENERLDLIRQCGMVDKVVLGDKGNFMKHIAREKPDVICLGYDQWAQEKKLRSDSDSVGLAKTRIVRLAAYKPHKAKAKFLRPGWKKKLPI